MKNKIILSVICCACLLVSGIGASATSGDYKTVAADSDHNLDSLSPIISVLFNGQPLSFDQPPIIENDRTLVPLRVIFEALGAEIGWNETTKTVTAAKDDIEITLQIGSDVLSKNGAEIILDVPAKIVGGRTLVPLRAVAESFDAQVSWNQWSHTVTILKDYEDVTFETQYENYSVGTQTLLVYWQNNTTLPMFCGAEWHLEKYNANTDQWDFIIDGLLTNVIIESDPPGTRREHALSFSGADIGQGLYRIVAHCWLGGALRGSTHYETAAFFEIL